MIMDSRSQLVSAASIAAAAGTALLGSEYDRTVAGNVDIDGLSLVIMATTGIITGGSAGLLRFQFASHSSAAIPVDGSAVVHYQTGDFVTGATPIAAGSVLFVCELPRGSGVLPTYKRFLGVLSVITTTTITAGAVSAFFTLDGARYASLPRAVN